MDNSKPNGSRSGKVYIEPIIRSIAGTLILAVAPLIYLKEESGFIWLLVLLFLGFNLLQSGISGFCLMEKMLKAMHLNSELDEIRSLSRELQARNEQQADYLDTLKLLNEAIVELSLDGRILSASDGWNRLVGDDDFRDKRLTDFVVGVDRAQLTRLGNELQLRPGQPRRINFRLQAADGQSRWVSANFMLSAQTGRHTIKGVLSDISEIKHLEDERRHIEQELTHARRLSNLGEMAAGLAHELNQPLAAINLYIQGCVQRLESDPASAREITEAMKLASSQARRAGAIIQQIRNFVRKAPLQRVETPVNTLVREAIDLLDADPQAQQTEFRLDLDETLEPVALDALQIKQVLVNLMQNALEAMQDKDAGHRLTLRTRRLEDSVCVCVEDLGCGVPESITGQLFEPFVTGRENGLGLGLAICQSIIDQHGGKLWFEPAGDSGSRFCFTLPADEPEHSQDETHVENAHSLHYR